MQCSLYKIPALICLPYPNQGHYTSLPGLQVFPWSEFFTSFHLEQLNYATAQSVCPQKLLTALPIQKDWTVTLFNEIGNSGDRNHEQNILCEKALNRNQARWPEEFSMRFKCKSMCVRLRKKISKLEAACSLLEPCMCVRKRTSKAQWSISSGEVFVATLWEGKTTT